MGIEIKESRTDTPKKVNQLKPTGPYSADARYQSTPRVVSPVSPGSQSHLISTYSGSQKVVSPGSKTITSPYSRPTFKGGALTFHSLLDEVEPLLQGDSFDITDAQQLFHALRERPNLSTLEQLHTLLRYEYGSDKDGLFAGLREALPVQRGGGGTTIYNALIPEDVMTFSREISIDCLQHLLERKYGQPIFIILIDQEGLISPQQPKHLQGNILSFIFYHAQIQL